MMKKDNADKGPRAITVKAGATPVKNIRTISTFHPDSLERLIADHALEWLKKGFIDVEDAAQREGVVKIFERDLDSYHAKDCLEWLWSECYALDAFSNPTPLLEIRGRAHADAVIAARGGVIEVLLDRVLLYDYGWSDPECMEGDEEVKSELQSPIRFTMRGHATIKTRSGTLKTLMDELELGKQNEDELKLGKEEDGETEVGSEGDD
ncbi:hypothetical protein BDY17DRAFT_25103 [Neohortaea acidophila]|uniref:Uncharacterized protein n=1 Tax=Neohortaea acidophila TaxID=245834 RepID=A0A6A6Q802_9PEZI|nr:uncharacterized protein BDY17DRAFT_25103 [Neohortaea acidophila]KAF2488179.1 hypothetical protein BDY17DRAFT_25103 [Neohortaea acidophila]